MNDKFESFVVVLFLTISGFVFIAVPEVTEGETIEVPGDYQTIQSAVNFAESGDIISVSPGTYYEEVVVDKPLTIRASAGDPSETIVEGEGGDIFSVEADGVEISGFTIKTGYYGIIQKNANNCSYINNIISYSTFGLKIEGDLQTTLTGNRIRDNHIHHIYQDPLKLEYSSENTIRGNEVEANYHGGISLYYSDQNVLVDNSLSGHSLSFHLRGSEENVIDDNYIYESSKGVYLEAGSNYNIITNNTIIESYSGGIYLATWSNHNDIYHNIVIGTKIKAGISLYNCEMNHIYQNDFIDTYKGAFDDGDNIWWKTYPAGGNYWSNHTGVDERSGPNKQETGSDGFIDERYYIEGGSNYDDFPRVEPYNEIENNRPEASFSVDPKVGNTTTDFIFDASESSDKEDDVSDLRFRWDWESDGIYDTNWLTMARTVKKYPAAGTYEVVLEVKDTGGLTDTFVQEVTVHGVMTEPRNFECMPGDSVVVLSWDEPESDGGSEIVGYKIYKGTSGDTLQLFKTVDHRTFSYRDTQVENGVTYYYMINAFSEHLEGKKAGLCGTTPREKELAADFTWRPFYPKEGDLICLKDLSSEGKYEIINWTFDIDNGLHILYEQGCVMLETGVYSVNLTVYDGTSSDSITKDIVVADDISFDLGPGYADVSPDWDHNVSISVELEVGTQFVISQYPENPTNATLADNLFQIGVYFGAEINNSDGVIWPITIRVYYSDEDIDETGVDELSLTIYYWDEDDQGWVPVENGCTVNTTDQNGYSGYVECEIDHLTIFTVAGSNIPPMAVCGDDITADAGDTVIFDAGDSTDDIGITNYTWTFEYEGETHHLYGETAEFEFKKKGTYKVELVVKDANDNTDSNTITITITEEKQDEVNYGFYAVFIVLILIVITSVWLAIKRRKVKR